MKIFRKYKIAQIKKEIEKCNREIARIDENLEAYRNVLPITTPVALEISRLYRQWQLWTVTKNTYMKKLQDILIAEGSEINEKDDK